MKISKTTFKTQYGKLDRPFKLAGTEMDRTQPPKWISGKERKCWIHIFTYKDERGGQFKVHENYTGELTIIKN